MICVAPSEITTSSDVTAAGAPTPGLTNATSYAPVGDDADRVIAVLERHVVNRLDIDRAITDDVAEPAHHGALKGSPTSAGGWTD